MKRSNDWDYYPQAMVLELPPVTGTPIWFGERIVSVAEVSMIYDWMSADNPTKEPTTYPPNTATSKNFFAFNLTPPALIVIWSLNHPFSSFASLSSLDPRLNLDITLTLGLWNIEFWKFVMR